MKADLMLFIAAIFVAGIVTVAGCVAQPQPKPAPQPEQPLPQEQPKTEECSSDTDCGTGGCSGQVCATAEEAKGLITTCEYREEYGCLKLTSCGCVEGKCAWKENEGYRSCLTEIMVRQQRS